MNAFSVLLRARLPLGSELPVTGGPRSSPLLWHRRVRRERPVIKHAVGRRWKEKRRPGVPTLSGVVIRESFHRWVPETENNVLLFGHVLLRAVCSAPASFSRSIFVERVLLCERAHRGEPRTVICHRQTAERESGKETRETEKEVSAPNRQDSPLREPTTFVSPVDVRRAFGYGPGAKEKHLNAALHDLKARKRTQKGRTLVALVSPAIRV